VDQAETLEWAGIGFGHDTSILIQKSLKRLAAATGASELRFFGKVFGQTQDYWVAFGRLNQQEEEPKSREQERRGKGVNATVFWVTHNLMNDWIQLPDIEPHQIVAARHIVKLFTGNLNASIDSNPQFPGKERHLLRAQLARIQHTCELSIKGEFEIDEETNEVKPTEEFAVPPTDELRSLESWAHKNPIILKAGRCTHIEPLGMEEEAL
jgi:hypothetical protein